MNAWKLTQTTVTGLLAVAWCLLGQPSAASPKNPVTRPVKVIEGHLTITVNPETGAYERTDWGWATHTGLFSNSGAGILNLATGEFLSGTGRFQGVGGGFLAVITSVLPLSVNDDGTLTLAINYEGSGTITY